MACPIHEPKEEDVESVTMASMISATE